MAMASTNAAIVDTAGCTVTLMPNWCAASDVTGPIAATTVRDEQIDRLFLAVDRREVAHRRWAGERHHVDRIVEQHPVDVRAIVLLGVFEDCSVRNDVGDQRTAIAESFRDDVAADVCSGHEYALALERSGVGHRVTQRLAAELVGDEVGLDAIAGESLRRAGSHATQAGLPSASARRACRRAGRT